MKLPDHSAAAHENSSSSAQPPLLEKAIRAAFREFILDPAFPCVAAKAAVNAHADRLHVYDELASPGATAALSRDLAAFVEEQKRIASDYVTFVAVFKQPLELSETEFEVRLWSQLRQLNREDAAAHFAWDPHVSDDPRDPHFAFSFAGHAFFIVGLHSQSSREARRFPWPALVFNLHEQFEKLREHGRYEHMRHVIRERDTALQGSANPMLEDFGQASEARQYSGRAVDEKWTPPFSPASVETPNPGECPFQH